MANSRDFTGKNRKFTGTKGVTVPKGTTGQRVGSESGELRFNTTTELMEYYDGNSWKPIDAPPTISGVTTSDSTGNNTILNADGSTLYTITISGGNFGAGVSVKFIGNTGTEYSAGNVNRVSGSSITCTTLSNMGTTDDPYDVQVTNASGLAAVLEDAFSYNVPPVFATASGTLGSVYNTQVISGSTLNASATDAEGNTITYSIVSGSLPGSGLTLSSSTGLITGTLSGSPSLGNYPFVVRAATAEGFVERQFSIQVSPFPFIQATGGTVTTSGDFKIHTFTSSGSFVVSNAGSPASGGTNVAHYLVVAGGGTGGGGHGAGGGAGGFRESYDAPTAGPYSASPLATPTGITLTATTYPITVGGGGSPSVYGTPGTAPPSYLGGPSVFSTITSTGGGYGGSFDSTPLSGSPGGSGGGGGNGAGTGTGSGGSGNSPPVAPPQGNNGSPNGPNGADWAGAGGGGAGGVGNPASSNNSGGPGGNGATTSITGSPVTRAGGGGGGTGGSGGPGGGGTSNGGAGGENLGGGGGGARSSPGGAGGSGIVVIRYKYQ